MQSTVSKSSGCAYDQTRHVWNRDNERLQKPSRIVVVQSWKVGVEFSGWFFSVKFTYSRCRILCPHFLDDLFWIPKRTSSTSQLRWNAKPWIQWTTTHMENHVINMMCCNAFHHKSFGRSLHPGLWVDGWVLLGGFQELHRLAIPIL